MPIFTANLFGVTMRFSILAVSVFSLLASPAFAQDKKDAIVPLAPAPSVQAPVVPQPVPQPVPPAPPAVNIPDTKNIMFMENLRKIGANIYYLGEVLGLHGWFVVKDNQVQILYTTQDQKAILVGALLTAEGANLSQQQVLKLSSENPDVAKALKNSSTSNGQQQPKVVQDIPPQQPQAQANTPDAPTTVLGASPSEKFFDALQKTASLTFGKEGAPQLIMIMDVNCPHCHNTWKMLEPFVDGGKIRVTMVPIGALGPQSEAQGANWLSSPEPYAAWKKHVAGDDAIFEGAKPDPAKLMAVRDNTNLIRKWGVDQTPYILYHGKNGKVRLVIGEPKGTQEIMNDIGN